MRFIPTILPEVILIEPTVFSDNRGFYGNIQPKGIRQTWD